jgi:hypothetical protein
MHTHKNTKITPYCPLKQPPSETTKSSETPSAIPPVWIRVPEACRITGFCRASIYSLISAGKVKSFTNKIRPDCQRGTRLISYDSLVEYLERQYQEAAASKSIGGAK